MNNNIVMLDKFNAKTQTKELQDAVSPAKAIELLKNGNRRFFKNRRLQRMLKKQVFQTSSGQYPFAAILSCIDSRVPSEIIFDQGIGDIFNCRIAGNVLNKDILGSLEFACGVAGAKVIVVMGHTSCGAVKGACNKVKLGNLTQLLEKLSSAIDGVKSETTVEMPANDPTFIDKVAARNVLQTIDDIKKESVILNSLLLTDKIDIVGAMYDVQTGEAKFLV